METNNNKTGNHKAELWKSLFKQLERAEEMKRKALALSERCATYENLKQTLDENTIREYAEMNKECIMLTIKINILMPLLAENEPFLWN